LQLASLQHLVERDELFLKQRIHLSAERTRLLVEERRDIALWCGRREVRPADALREIDELLGELHRPADDILATPGDAQLEQMLLDRDELLLERIGGRAHVGTRGVGA